MSAGHRRLRHGRGGGRSGGGSSGGGRSGRRGHCRRTLLHDAAGGLHTRPDRGGQFGHGHRDDGYAQPLGQRGGDGGDAGSPADGRHGDEICLSNSTALQRILQFIQKPRERLADCLVELGAGDPEFAVDAGQRRGQRCRRRRRQPLLGRAALGAKAPERVERRRAREVDRARLGQSGDDGRQQRLVDDVAREVQMAEGRADRREAPCRVGERDTGAAAAEVADGDHAAGGHPGVVLQGRQRSCRVGDDDRSGRAEFGPRAEDTSEGGDGGRGPVRRVGHPDRFRRRSSVEQLGEHGAQRVTEHDLGAMWRSVAGEDGHRVPNPVDEVADDQARFREVGILARDADLRWPVREPRQHCGTGDRCPPDVHRHQRSGADGQPYAVGHVNESSPPLESGAGRVS